MKLPFPPETVPAEVAPSPQLIVAEYALAVALRFGSAIVATVVFSAVPAVPVSDRPPVGTVSTISVSNENVCEDAPASSPGNA